MAINKRSIPSLNMASSHPGMIMRHSTEPFDYPLDTSSSLTASNSPSPDVTTMINQWLDTQSSSYVPQSTAHSSSSVASRSSGSSRSSNLGRKQVHWASNLEDYDKHSYYKDSSSPGVEKMKPSLSKSKRRTKYPPVPEPPKARGPPPAPRPRRLPTPDLLDMDHGDFCNCCSKSVMKMNAQMTAATQYMAGAKYAF